MPGWGQNASQSLLPPRFIPKSPTVTAFQRFDTQQLVNLPTGGAQLSIPLTEISTGTLHLPVSLAYSFTGLQVYQPRELVGLGWSLQAGTSISLQISGLPDNAATASTDRYTPDSMNYPTQAYLRRVANNDVDTGPDLYSFTLPGGVSGHFMLRDTAIILVPAQPVHIRRVFTQTSSAFQVTTEDGIRYQFQAAEQTSPGKGTFGFGSYTSAWHLTRIISTDNADTLRLHYSKQQGQLAPARFAVTTGRYVINPDEGINSRGGSSICGDITYNTTNSFAKETGHAAQFLDSITVRGASLLFLRQSGTQVLQEVRLLATLAGRREIKRFTLFQSHFSGYSDVISSGDIRLRLDSVQERANGLSIPPYKFAYNDIAMPPRSSAAQDYWGYYNGALTNGDVAHVGGPGLLADPLLGDRKANRAPVFSTAVGGALLEVTYPTGGAAHWEYEPSRLGFEQRPASTTARDTLSYSTGTDYNNGIPALAPQAPRPSTQQVVYSDKIQFELTQAATIKVDLRRTVLDEDPLQRNKFRDFNLWKCESNGDSTLITSGEIEAQYRAETGTDFRRFFLKQASGLDLVPGHYAVQVYCEPDERCAVDVFVPRTISLTGSPIEGPPAAGVRVRRTETVTPGALPLIHTYDYLVPDSVWAYGSGTQLTGVYSLLENAPIFREDNLRTWYPDGYCREKQTSSDVAKLGDEYSKYPFFYRCVTVRDGQQQGATVHYFEAFNSLFNDVLPVKRQVYRQVEEHKQQLVQEESFAYVQDSIIKLPMIRARMTQQIAGSAHTVEKDEYVAEYYNPQWANWLPCQTQTVRYDEANTPHVTLTHSRYKRQRLVRTATRTSTGWDIQRYKHLSDYVPLPAVTALRVNFFNPVLETQTWHQALGSPDSVLTAGELTRYDPTWRNPAALYRLRLDRPQTGPNQETRAADGHYSSFLSDTRYEPEARVRYAAKTGDVIEQRPAHGPATSYLMGYDHTLVIAQAQNATYAQVACTSFEPSATGRWQYDSVGTHRQPGGRTGRWAYRLDGGTGVSRNQLPAGDYELSFWRQGTTDLTLTLSAGASQPGGLAQLVADAPGDWHQYRTRLHFPAAGGQVVLNATSNSFLVDEVRLAPVGARLTSYTHDPLIGETSVTGPDGRTVFYEYDGLGRLVRTRDEQGRILAQQQYHYAGK